MAAADEVALATFPVSMQWFDYCTEAELLCSVLRYCDTAQGLYWRSLMQLSAEERDQLQQMWSSAVMVSNTVELHCRADAVPDAATALVTPWLTRVGKSSWALAFSLALSRPRDQGVDDAAVLLARVSTVMVGVDPDDPKRSRPIPPALLPLLKQLQISATATMSARGLEPAAAVPVVLPGDGEGGNDDVTASFVWRSSVRATDCDSLQHINNAKYALLAEEARAVGVHEGALPVWLGSSGCRAVVFSCEYMGQPHPFDALAIHTYVMADAAAGAGAAGGGAAAAAADARASAKTSCLGFRVCVGEETVARMAMRLQPSAGASL
jgi:acyl-CoA thioesterase FadM